MQRLFESLEKDASVLNRTAASDGTRVLSVIDMLWALARMGLKPGVRALVNHASGPFVPVISVDGLPRKPGGESAPLPWMNPVPSRHDDHRFPTLVERLATLLIQYTSKQVLEPMSRARLMWAMGELQMGTPYWYHCWKRGTTGLPRWQHFNEMKASDMLQVPCFRIGRCIFLDMFGCLFFRQGWSACIKGLTGLFRAPCSKLPKVLWFLHALFFLVHNNVSHCTLSPNSPFALEAPCVLKCHPHKKCHPHTKCPYTQKNVLTPSHSGVAQLSERSPKPLSTISAPGCPPGQAPPPSRS